MMPFNRFGRDNHFQGIQRLSDGTHFVLSGGDIQRHEAMLAIGQVTNPEGSSFYRENSAIESSSHADEYHLQKMAWKTNLGPAGGCISCSAKSIPAGDKILKVIKISSGKYWHAGGMDRVGDSVAVPIENEEAKQGSIVQFFDFSNPLEPQLLYTLQRDQGGAGQVGLYPLESGLFLLLVRDGDDVDFYISQSSDLRDGFRSVSYSWRSESVEGDAHALSDRDFSFGGSSESLVADCDTKELYLLEFDASGKWGGLIHGQNFLHLFKVQGPWSVADETVHISLVQARKVGVQNTFFDQKFNFAAAAGMYITVDQKLSILSAEHFREIRFPEFWSYKINMMQFTGP
jgi:hypothetical protein